MAGQESWLKGVSQRRNGTVFATQYRPKRFQTKTASRAEQTKPFCVGAFTMTHKTIERRAAEVRRHWSKEERQQRARASEFRCMDLATKICWPKNAPAAAWAVRKPA
jgi:hypothetical protein